MSANRLRCSASPRSARTRAQRLLAALLSFLLAHTTVLGQADPASQPTPDLPDARTVDAAVDRALVFLASSQARDGNLSPAQPEARIAITSLASLAFLSAGQTPSHGRFGIVLTSAQDFLLRSVDANPNAYVGALDQSRMYGQGLTALALSQFLGAETDPDRQQRLRSALTKTLAVILKAQSIDKPANLAGGWRYEPDSTDSDLSLTGWNVLALHGAKLAGLTVPTESFRRAAGYVFSCRTPSGGFAYQPGQEPRPASTAAGVIALAVSTFWEVDLATTKPGASSPLRFALDSATPGSAAPEFLVAMEYLLQHPPRLDEKFPYYRAHHTLHAAQLAGPAYYLRAARATLPLLLARQKPDGSFEPSPDPQEPGPYYATALAALSLTLQHPLLPAYQRASPP